MTGIAVVDLESTGLGQMDRAVEIGVVLMDAGGEIEATFSTLINPHRDVSAGHIHGVSASDVVQAPDFAALSHYLAHLLAGRVLVAHNAWFDLSLLAREFAPTVVPFPDVLPAVCTMRMCSEMLRDVRSREMACEYLSIPTGQDHSALDDALACAQIFRSLVWEMGDPQALCGAGTFHWQGDLNSGRLLSEDWDLASLVDHAAGMWPSFGPPAAPPDRCTRSDAQSHRREADSRIARLISRLPAAASPAGWASVEYLAMLDAVLLDRLVTEQEAADLDRLAADLGLTAASARATHRHYVERLAQAALRDGVVTAEERTDLERVCELLDVDSVVLDELLVAVPGDQLAATSAVTLEVGDRLTFTGATNPSRSVLEGMAINAGLEVAGLAKKTKYLVAADPNSESGKARKARDYGVPVISAQMFLYAVEDLLTGQHDE